MYEDLSGRVFQNLKVIKQADDFVSPTNGRLERMWECECLLCGDHIVTRERNLKSGHIKSCGKKHRQVEDLTGRKYGDLTVIERAPNVRAKDGTSYVMWRCACKCGETIVTRATSLTSGHTKSCGRCTRRASNMNKGVEDLTGRDFGFWHVLGMSRRIKEPRGRYVILWKCQCKCGEIREIRGGTLKSGLSISCGCHKMEVARELASHGTRLSVLEKKVSTWLTEQGFYFEPQKVYPDLRGKLGYPLSYDFLVYVNDNPRLLIECQGRQHYESVEYFGGEKQFEVQKRNDEAKREYAKILGLKLLEIPYTMTNDQGIAQLLERMLHSNST